MNDKVQTSLWLKHDLYSRMKLDGLNFTNWVNETLEQYFSMNNEEQITKRLLEIDAERKTLESRLKVLAEDKKRSITGSIEYDTIFNELYNVFVARREIQGCNADTDYTWITSPRNTIRCKMMKINPDEVLQMLYKLYEKRGEKDGRK